jgi:hypothetical protein
VVVHGRQIGDEQHGQLGQAQVVLGFLGQRLDPANDVVGEIADEAAGERRQPRQSRTAQRPPRRAEYL